MIIDGLDYLVPEDKFKWILNGFGSKYAYANPNAEKNWYDKTLIRVYNHIKKEHYWLERVWPEVGDSNLLFVDFPRSDAPTYSWASDATQHALVRTWAHFKKPEEIANDFIRYKITHIDQWNYCNVDDGYNKPDNSGYARDCFYRITKHT